MKIEHLTWLLSAVIDKKVKKLHFLIEINTKRDFDKKEEKELLERIESLIIHILEKRKMTILNIREDELKFIFEEKVERILDIENGKILKIYLD